MVDSNQRPRLSRLQFSLRAVLVLLTCVAITGWWWQKRYQVENTYEQKWVSRDHKIRDGVFKQTTSLRRQGLDRVVPDGPTTVVDGEGKLISEEEWRQGKRHGLYRRWDEDGELLFECEFKRGKLVRIGDTEVLDFLHIIETSDDKHADRMGRALHGDVAFDYLDQPLNAVIDDIHFNHNIPIMIDVVALDESAIHTDTPITSNIRRVPLFVAMTEMLAPLKLTCLYRHEVLWITARDSMLTDDDRAARVVIDRASPQLLKKLAGEASFDYLDQSLNEVLDDVCYTHNVLIDRSVIDPAEPVSLNIRGISLRSALGTLFHLHALHCETHNDMLIVTDAEGKSRKPKRTQGKVLEKHPPPSGDARSPL